MPVKEGKPPAMQLKKAVSFSGLAIELLEASSEDEVHETKHPQSHPATESTSSPRHALDLWLCCDIVPRPRSKASYECSANSRVGAISTVMYQKQQAKLLEEVAVWNS